MSDGQEEKGSTAAQEPVGEYDNYWLDLARSAYSDSTDYIDSNLRKQWEVALHHFRGEHAPGSKYRRPEYQTGNKAARFFPKTRAVIKSGEASVAAAMFSSSDLVVCEPGDDANPVHRLSAAIHQALLQYRLEKTIPWFLTCVGAYQLAAQYGMCISYNWWCYESVEETIYVPAVDDFGQPVLSESGEQMLSERRRRKVVKDKPCVDLIPLENVRFSPDADWRDPLQSSPYLIFEVPMYAGDVIRKMEDAEAFGQKVAWRKFSMTTIIAHGATKHDSTRKAREGDKRTDPHEANSGTNEFTTVWLRKTFMRLDGIDYLFWTIGDTLVLSDPVPADRVYFHGQRPYTFGIVNIEALRNYPAGTAEVIAPLQEESNDIRNERRQNVGLALNRRWFVKRGEAIDVQSLMRNVAGGGIPVDDPEKSVREVTFSDVTGSSYQEQDRVDLSIDEISGNFSQTSVMSNRQLNETVGGMKMLGDSAFAIQDYGVRIFVETWVEKTIEQIRLLEAYYESDATILHLAATKADAYKQLGIESIGAMGAEGLEALLIQDISVRVNVGMGATTPERRLQRLVTAITTANNLAPDEAQRNNTEEIRNEVFAIAGYKNGGRFRLSDDELKEKQEKNPPQMPPDLQAKMEQINASREADQRRHELAMAQLEVERELGYAKLASAENVTLKELETRLGIAIQQDRTKRDATLLAHLAKTELIQSHNEELQYKKDTGNPGI